MLVQALHFANRGVMRGVKFPGLGSEKDVDSDGGAFRAVRLKGPRITREILAGAELQGIHENGNDGEIVASPAILHQFHVSGVQGPHGGDESHAFIRRQGGAPGAELGEGAEGVQCFSPGEK